jgi:hypothetical protein
MRSPGQKKTGRKKTAQASIFCHEGKQYFIQQDSNFGIRVKKQT